MQHSSRTVPGAPDREGCNTVSNILSCNHPRIRLSNLFNLMYLSPPDCKDLRASSRNCLEHFCQSRSEQTARRAGVSADSLSISMSHVVGSKQSDTTAALPFLLGTIRIRNCRYPAHLCLGNCNEYKPVFCNSPLDDAEVPLLDPQQELVGTKIVAVPISSTSFSSSSLLLAQSFFTATSPSWKSLAATSLQSRQPISRKTWAAEYYYLLDWLSQNPPHNSKRKTRAKLPCNDREMNLIWQSFIEQSAPNFLQLNFRAQFPPKFSQILTLNSK
jgi:hypothetical protein